MLIHPRAEAPARRQPHQQSLFRIIPFETIAPPRGAGKPAGPRRGPKGFDPNQRGLFPSAPPPPVDPPAQAAAATASVVCRAPVAALGARAAAAAVDVSIALAGYAVILGVFRIGSGEFPLGPLAASIHGGACLSIILIFKLLAALRAAPSPGLRLLGLRVLHFDGRPPSKPQRFLRAAAGVLSVLPAGIGLIWALMDEERLTFHDHISETFVTLDSGRP